MATFSNMICVFFLVFFVSSASSSDSLHDLTKSINKFSADLLKEVSNRNIYAGKNFCTSGMSTHMLLSLMSYGAQGKTLLEMNTALYTNNPQTKEAYKDLIKKLASYVKVSNKVYVKQGDTYTLHCEFETKAKDIFGGDVEKIDFSNNKQAAADINYWVEQQTDSIITGIVKAGDFNDKTTSVLVNTIYYKGQWSKAFDPHNTKKSNFKVDNKHVITVDMMKQIDQHNYGENAALDAKILQLDFNHRYMTMVFILPNKVEGLKELEKKLKNIDVEELVKSLKSNYVAASLPKINIMTNAQLNGDLSKLGMSTMFSKKAQFGKIHANLNIALKVDYVIQNVFLDMNEAGITTANGGGDQFEQIVIRSPKTFNADHPYYVKSHRKRDQFEQKVIRSPKTFNADHPYFFAMVNSDYQVVYSGHFTGLN